MTHYKTGKKNVRREYRLLNKRKASLKTKKQIFEKIALFSNF
jgi:hypothetical protein